MTDRDVVVAEGEDASDSNDTLESSALLHDIYREEVFNKVDNLIEDAPTSLPNTTQGTQLRQKWRRKGSQKIEIRSNSWKQKGSKRGDSTYQPKCKSRAAKVNAKVAIIFNSSYTNSKTNEEAPTLSEADQQFLSTMST
jgi:hypothetical protein